MPDPILHDDPLWYKDAIIYEVHIKAFKDSNTDGIGDLRGLIDKLDYLENLGVTALWILPFYPSPLKDDGYDISDYFGIHSEYGVMDDFKDLLAEAHTRNLKVITELVLNHTSDQHPLFKRARLSPAGSAARNMYVWSDTADKYAEARIIFRDYEISNWTFDPVAKAYYWHRFYAHQPDLNYDAPDVQKMCFEVVDFWLRLGVDGLRLDAVPYLFEREGTTCENLPDTHAFLASLRAHVDKEYPHTMLLGEANQWPEDAAAYFGAGDECQMAFHFPLMPRIYMAIQMEDRFPITDIIEQTPSIPDTCQWAIFLRNHDELTLEMVTDEERDYMYKYYARDRRSRINLGIRRRLAPLVENNRRKIELLNILLFSFPGTPIIYYGDEIGMGDNFYLGDRNGVRTPMQWNADRNAGFSDAHSQNLYLPVIIDPEYHYEAVNTDVQLRNPSSLLWWMKRVIALRKNHRAFSRGSIEFLHLANPKVLCFIRTCGDDSVLVVANLSRYSQVAEIDLDQHAGCTPVEAFSRNKFPVVKEGGYRLTLTGHDYYWFILTKERYDVHGASASERAVPELTVRGSWKDVLTGGEREEFEDQVLPGFIRQLAWMAGRDHDVQAVTLTDVITLPFSGEEGIIAVVRIHRDDKAYELYVLPLAAASGEKAERIRRDMPAAAIARVHTHDGELLLYDGIYDETFRAELLRVVTSLHHIKSQRGDIISELDTHSDVFGGNGTIPTQNILVASDDRVSQLVYGGTILVKIYRKLEEGMNHGIEMLRTLSERKAFPHIPRYAGEVIYRPPGSEKLSLCLVKEYVPNDGDAWMLVLDSIKNYFDNVITKNETEEITFIPGRTVFNPRDFLDIDRETTELTKLFYAEMFRLLARRTGELHVALSSITDDSAFISEPFSSLDQRLMYQSTRTLIKQTLRMVRQHASSFSDEHAGAAAAVLAGENTMLVFIRMLLARRITGLRIRVHGNYHLSQLKYTGKDFIVTNFEGTGDQPLGERRIKTSPLADVACMLWSFYYAVYSGFHQYKTTRPEEIAYLEPYAKQWWLWVSTIFVREYMKTVKPHKMIPAAREELEFLLKYYLLERLLKELDTFILQRPQKLSTPLNALVFLLGVLMPEKSGEDVDARKQSELRTA